MNNLDWALLYKRRGINVVPIAPGGKIPLIKEWEDRQVTEEEIHGWWKQWPDADLGIVTGPVSNLLVLDIDEGGSTALAKKPIPPTWAVKTKRGIHYYFRFPEELKDMPTTKRGIYPGVDVRGRGGQVLAPPSRLGHPTPSYFWMKDMSGPLAPAPDWLVKLLMADSYDTDNLGDLHAGAGKGQRHDALVSLVAGLFNQGFTEPQIVPKVEEWNSKNRPPYTAERLAHDLNGIMHYFTTGRYLTRKQREYKQIAATAEDTSHVESPAVAVDDYFKHLEAVALQPEPEMKFGFTKLDEVAWGIERKEIIVVGAGPGVGKTNLLMNVAVNLGQQSKRVLYFSTEMDRNKIYHRYFSMATGVPHRNIKTGQMLPDQKARLNSYKDEFRRTGFHVSKAHAPDIHMVRSACEKYEPDVLMFDYIQHIKVSTGESRRLEIMEFMMGLKEMSKDLNMATLCASQFNRPGKDLKTGKIRPFTVYDFAESSNIEKEASIAMIVQKPDDSPDVMIPVQIDVVKNRDDSMPTFTLMFDKRTARFYEEILDEF